jgi:malate synthase
LILVSRNISEKTRQREIAGVTEAMQAFQLNEGWILTMEDSEDIAVEGGTIHVVPVWKYLCAY